MPQDVDFANLKNESILVGGFNQPLWKILVKMEIFPRKGWKSKSIWNHHLVLYIITIFQPICLGKFQNLPSTIYHLWTLTWYIIYVGLFRKASATKRPTGSPELHPDTIDDMNCHTVTRVPTTIPLAPCLWYLWYLIPPWCAKYTKRTSIILKISLVGSFWLDMLQKRYTKLSFQRCVGREKV